MSDFFMLALSPILMYYPYEFMHVQVYVILEN